MSGIEELLADELIGHQIDLFRLEAHTRAEVLKLLDRLQRELIFRLSQETLTDYGKARLQKMLREASSVIDEYYMKAGGEMALTLPGVGEVQAKAVADSLAVAFKAQITAGLPTETYLARLVTNVLIQGAPSGDWWSRQSLDTSFKFANAVRQGLAQGETNEQIVSRIAGKRGVPGIMDVSKTNARALVQASVQAVAADARRETFRKNSDVITGIRQLSTLDGHTTDICIAYSGAEYTLDGEPINGTKLPYNGGVPRHWGCRSVEVPITKTFKDLGIDMPEPAPSTRASSEGQISAKTTFEQWLSRRTKEQQDEQLGPGRAELWRKGVITLQQLLDMQGNPLTLAQLRAKYA